MSGDRVLPDGWRLVKFGDVVRKVNDKVDPETAGIERYIAGEHMDTDDLRIRRWGNVGEGYLGPAFHMRFQPGQVLYGSRRTYLRKVALADFEGICANTTFVVESATPDLLPEFLPYVMTAETFHEHSIQQSKGSVNPYINFSDLTWYEFALPPVEEQQWISEILATCDQVVDRHRAAVSRAESARHSLVDAATWDRDRGIWKVPLRSVGDLVRESPQNGTSPPGAEGSAGTMTVSLSAVQNGRFLLEDEFKKWCAPTRDVSAFIVQPGDAFVVRGNGNRRLVGRIGLCTQPTAEPCIYPDLLIRVRFDDKLIDPIAATEIWNNRLVHEHLLARAKSSNGIYKVNGKDIRAHEIPVPSMADQALLSHQLVEARALEALLAGHLDSTTAARVAIHEHLLSGTGV